MNPENSNPSNPEGLRRGTLILGAALGLGLLATWCVLGFSGIHSTPPVVDGVGTSNASSAGGPGMSVDLGRPLGEGSRSSFAGGGPPIGMGGVDGHLERAGAVELWLLDESESALGGERVRLLVAGSGSSEEARSANDPRIVDDARASHAEPGEIVGLATWGGLAFESSIAGWTGDDGRLEFAELPTGRFLELVFEGPTRARATLSLAPLAPGERRILRDCRVPEGASLVGRVVDGSGLPVVGAWVTASRTHSAMQFLSDPSGSLGPLGIREARVRTGAKGEFRFDALLAGSLGLLAQAPGYVDSRVHHIDLGSPAEEPGSIELRLDIGGRIAGVVVDGTGSPRADARVGLVSFLEGLRAHGEAPRAREEILGSGIRTDSLGAFELGGHTEGRASTLVVVGPDRAALAVEAPSPGESIRVVLPRACPLVGRVRDGAGLPVEGAEILVESESPADLIPWHRSWSTADGIFGIEGLTEGFHRLRVVSAQGAADQRILVGADMDEVEVELGGGANLRLTLRDHFDDSLRGVEVRLIPDPSARGQLRAEGPIAGTPTGPHAGPLSGPIHLRSDASGLCRFLGVAPGSWRLEASLGGYASRSEALEIVEGMELDLAWTLEEASLLHLEVVAADGRAVPGAGVRLERIDPDDRDVRLESRFVRADDHGRCVLSDLNPGPWRVASEEIRSTMHGLEAQLHRVAGEGASALVMHLEPGVVHRERLILERESALRVRVTQGEQPVAGARVVLAQADHRADLLWRLATLEGGVATDARGWASLPAVPPGEYVLGGRRHLRSPVTLERLRLESGVTEVELALAQGRVRGRVLSGPRDELARAQVRLIPVNPLELGTVAMVAKRSDGAGELALEHGAAGFTANLAETIVHSSEDGGFVFQGVPEGEYRLLCAVPGHEAFELPDPLRVPRGGLRDLGELVLQPSCELTAEVRGFEGARSEGSAGWVRLERPDGEAVAMRHLAQDGRTRFTGIAPGSYRVVAQVGAGPAATEDIHVHPNRAGHAVLTLP